MNTNKLLPIKNLWDLIAITNVSRNDVRRVLMFLDNPYRVFQISKRTGKEKRIIHVPNGLLSILQTVINKYILKNVDIHSIATAYYSGASPYLNAQAHCNAKFIIKFDIKDFFHSFDEYDVFKVFNELLGYPKLISFEMARLCTAQRIIGTEKHSQKIHPSTEPRETILPQGAITSPALSNILMKKYDIELFKLAQEYNLRCTRYADDIVFSSDKQEYTKDIGTNILLRIKKIFKNKLIINKAKTKVFTCNQKMIVTGLLVNNSQPRLTKEYRNKLRQHAFFIKKFGYEKHSQHFGWDVFGFIEHFKGCLLWAKYVDPDFAGKIDDFIKDVNCPKLD